MTNYSNLATPPSHHHLTCCCLAEFFTEANTPCHTSASKLPAYFLLAGKSCHFWPWIPSDPPQSKLQQHRGTESSERVGGRGEGAEEEEGDDSSAREGRGRVDGGNSHVTGSSCSVDGKREIQQPQKKGMIDDDVVSLSPNVSIYHTAGRPDDTGHVFHWSLTKCLTNTKFYFWWGPAVKSAKWNISQMK